MDDLPGGWGLEMGVTPSVGVSKAAKTRLVKKNTKKPQKEKKEPVTTNLERKRKESDRTITTPEDASSKKNKTNPSSFSLVSSTLSPLAIPYIKDDEIIKWRNRTPIEENEAIIKASSEILVSALHRQSTLQQEGTRLETIERERNKLSKKVEDRDKIIDKLKNELRSKESYYESELKTQEEVSIGLSTTIDTLKEEKDKLSEQIAELVADQQNGWLLEKKKIEKSSFRDGFRNYASGFLAQDPDYDFTKFGEETVAWITQFKADEAASIKAKRIFLGLEAASPVPDEEEEDASSDGIPEHTFDDPPLNESVPALTETSKNLQDVEKVNNPTQDAS